MNPNIALSVQRPRFNALAAKNTAAQMQAAQQQGQLNALKLASAQQDMARQGQVRNALAGVDLTTPEGLRQAQGVYSRFHMPEKAMALADKLRGLEKDQLEMVGARLDVTSKLFNPSIVKDEQSYQAAVERARELGLNVPDGPYDPQAVEALWMQALDTKDALAQRNADRAHELAQIGKTKPYSPDVVNQKAALARQGASSVTVTPGEKKSQQLEAEYFSKMYQDLQGAARSSEKQLMDYRLIDRLIGDAYSGGGAGAVQAGKKLLRIAGIDAGDVSGPEAAAMVSNALALKLRSPEGGAGMPGAMSDKDREFLQSMVPSLTTTPEGRKLMVQVQERIAKRNREIAKLARDYKRKNRFLDMGFEDIVAERFGGADMFADLYEAPRGEAASAGGVPSIADLVTKYADPD